MAKCRNYKFTGKSIRNDVMLYKGTQGTVDVSTKLVTKLLEKREAEWNDLQKIKMVERVKEKHKKASNVNNMIKKLLADCKSWNGPATSSDELFQIIMGRPHQEKFTLRTEFAYFSHTHRADKVQRPELYRQNCISQAEKLENLCVLLTDDAQQCLATTANLATNDDGMKALSSTSNDGITEVNYEVNQCCVVLWAIPEEVNYEWLIGYIKEKSADGYIIDHLERTPRTQNKYWKYPKKPDLHLIEEEQILGVIIIGEWTPNSRNCKFILNNEKEIIYNFNQSTT